MHPGHLWACASGRLGPLSVGLAAKSQSGKANFETCNTPALVGALKGKAVMATQSLGLSVPDNSGHHIPNWGSPKYPPPLLNRQSTALAPAHICSVGPHCSMYQGTWSNSLHSLNWRVDASNPMAE